MLENVHMLEMFILLENVHMLEMFILLDIYHSFLIAGGHICSCVQKTNRA